MTDRNIPEILTVEMLEQSDLNPANHLNVSKNITSLDDCILVHKTKYMPNGILKTQRDIKEAYTDTYVSDFDSDNLVQIKHERNTVHFTLNGEVEDHKLGNFSGSKYIVLVHGGNINSKDFIGGIPVDTYTDGSYTLPDDSIILCPKAEMDLAKEKNSTLHVVGYEGEYADKYGNLLIQLLGYKLEKIGEHGWENTQDSLVVMDEYKNMGLKVATHSLTSEFKEEEIYEDIHRLYARIDILKEKKQITIENIQKVVELITGNIKIIMNQLKANKSVIRIDEYNRMLQIFKEGFLEKFGVSLSEDLSSALLNSELLDENKIEEFSKRMAKDAFRSYVYSKMEEYTNSFVMKNKEEQESVEINPYVVFYDDQTSNYFFQSLQNQNLVTREFINSTSNLIMKQNFSNQQEINQYLSIQLNIAISNKMISQLDKADIQDVNKILLSSEKIYFNLNEDATYSFGVNIMSFEDFEKVNLIAEELSKQGEYEFAPYAELRKDNIELDKNMKVFSFYEFAFTEGKKIASSFENNKGLHQEINTSTSLEEQAERLVQAMISGQIDVDGNSLTSEQVHMDHNYTKTMGFIKLWGLIILTTLLSLGLILLVSF